MGATKSVDETEITELSETTEVTINQMPNEFIIDCLSDSIFALPKEIWMIICMYTNYDANLILVSRHFWLWHKIVFTQILKFMMNHDLKNENDEHPCIFWKNRVHVVYFMYLQLQKGNHITFSFKEEDSSFTEHVRLQREYAHALNNVMIKCFPKYIVRSTKKVHKKVWNEGYESDGYDEVTGSWDNRSYDTGPCYFEWDQYYISVFPRAKHERSKKAYGISFYNDYIKCHEIRK